MAKAIFVDSSTDGRTNPDSSPLCLHHYVMNRREGLVCLVSSLALRRPPNVYCLQGRLAGGAVFKDILR